MTKAAAAKTSISILLVGLMVLLVACAEDGSAPNGDELNQMFAAQEKATLAAQSLQRAASQATSRADATREALMLIGQQTRVAQQARATETIFAQNARATQTTRAMESTRAADNAHATATAQIVQTTATAQSAQATTFARNAQATSTAQAANFTATAFSQNMLATATIQAQQAIATATADAQNAKATAASASATATSFAQNAQATAVSASATGTVIAAQVDLSVEQANQAKQQEQIRSWGMLALLFAFILLLGFFALRLIDAGVLRIRVIRDKTGVPYVITERDRSGRREILAPTRSPGAVTLITPPGAEPLQIAAEAVDSETTKRDQAVSLVIAASAGQGSMGEAVEEITASPRVQRIDEPPPHLMLPETRAKIDAEWKVLHAGR